MAGPGERTAGTINLPSRKASETPGAVQLFCLINNEFLGLINLLLKALENTLYPVSLCLS